VANTDVDISSAHALLSQLDQYARERNTRFPVVILYPGNGMQGVMLQAWSNSDAIDRLLLDLRQRRDRGFCIDFNYQYTEGKYRSWSWTTH
jgi:hypothetical protein